MPTDSEKKLILVVDDEPDVVTYLTTLFEDNGFETASAKDGEEALVKARDRKPNLITLDISMPKKSGVKFYREMKSEANLADVPVLVITAVTAYAGSGEDYEGFLSSRKHIPPPEGFISKPLDDREELLEKVRELTSRS